MEINLFMFENNMSCLMLQVLQFKHLFATRVPRYSSHPFFNKEQFLPACFITTKTIIYKRKNISTDIPATGVGQPDTGERSGITG